MRAGRSCAICGRRLEAMPGVEAATAATPLPLDGDTQNARWGTEAALTDPTRFQQATTYFVVPGYFDAMRTRVIEGRTFSEADNSPDARRHRHRPAARVEGVSRAVRGRPHAPRARAHAGARTVRGDRRRGSSAPRVAGRRRTRSDVPDGRLHDVRRREPLGGADVAGSRLARPAACEPRSPRSTRAPASSRPSRWRSSSRRRARRPRSRWS